LPFANLMISDERKTFLLDLVGSYTIQAPEQQFKDFVWGKGQGLNILLQYSYTDLIFCVLILIINPSGPSGVGKTLTAEGLSEHLKRPLYTVCN
jgi:hypothetical protein